MQIEIKSEDDIGVAVITGEIDSKTAPQAQGELLPVIEKFSKFVMDMTKVTFLSSAGLRMLLLIYRQATAKEGRVVLVGLSDEIKDTMTMTGFLKFFVIADSLQNGLQALA